MKLLSFILMLLLISSCAHNKIKPQKNEDKVSVNAALNLARTSYILACVKEAKVYKPKKSHLRRCKNNAALHMSENILPIINQ